MTDRFTVISTDDNGSRREWFVFDHEKKKIQSPGCYALKRQAKSMAARWNADHATAELEAPRTTGET